MPDRYPPYLPEPEPALPGEREVNESLVDGCADRIAAICQRKGLETALEIAGEVVRTFFDGDLEAARQHGRRHASLQALCKRDGMPSASTMSRMIGVLAQFPSLDPAVASHPALSLAHHALLLPVRDVPTKNALARLAVEQGLSRSQFVALTQAATRAEQLREIAATGRPGPKPRPPLVRALHQVRKAWDAVPTLTSRALLPELPPEEQLAVAAELEELGRALLRTAGHLQNQASALPRRQRADRRVTRRPSGDVEA
jgi:hypothetical protein